jgi:hypothetical protein
MAAVLKKAAAELDVTVDDGPVPVYSGWRGKRWGVPVTQGAKRCWVKLSEQVRALNIARLWNGPTTAHDTLPPEVVRPALFGVVDWTSDEFYYRAELYERLGPRCVAGPTTFLTAVPEFDDAWWGALRTSLDGLRTATTARRALQPRYLEVAVRRQLPFPGARPAVGGAPPHADLHWANVTTPAFALIDWERWGMAPAHWDIAMLHVVSLLAPAVAGEIRQRFAAEFADPAAAVAELGVIAWTLDNESDEDIEPLFAAARRRAAELARVTSP